MTLKIDDQLYALWFRYTWVRQDGSRAPKKLPRGQKAWAEWRKRYREATYCVVGKVAAELDSHGRPVIDGEPVRAMVVRKWDEVHSRRVAREWALMKAAVIVSLQHNMENEEVSAASTAREQRYIEAFQKAYVQQCRWSSDFKLANGGSA